MNDRGIGSLGEESPLPAARASHGTAPASGERAGADDRRCPAAGGDDAWASPSAAAARRPVADELALRRYRATQDPAVRAEIVRRWLPLARQLAGRYRRSGEPFEDLVQVASLGLVKAIDGFDPGRGVSFSSYAVPTILGELRRHFRDRTWSVHVPRRLQELAAAAEDASRGLQERTGRAPSVGQVALEMGTTEEAVLEALEVAIAYRAASLDAPVRHDGDEATLLADVLGATDDALADAERRATLDPLLSVLDERDREVLRLRFAEDLTQAEIGRALGISQMHVSRLIRGAIGRLRLAAG